MKARVWMAVVTSVALAACGGEEDAPEAMEFEGERVEQARANWPEGLSERIDSGNVAYREGRYEESADIFRRATAQNPHIGSTWFGLYMAEHALGNIEAADSALAQAEALTPGLQRVHGEAMSDSAGAMPEGHPAMPPEHPATSPATSPAGDSGPEGGTAMPSGH